MIKANLIIAAGLDGSGIGNRAIRDVVCVAFEMNAAGWGCPLDRPATRHYPVALFRSHIVHAFIIYYNIINIKYLFI